MSESPTEEPRVQRRHRPEEPFAEGDHRSAFPLLMEDFDNRCAYSMIHRRAVGDTVIEVDHFDPRPLPQRNRYENLFPAHRICNLEKSNKPKEHHRSRGDRFLNPCEEKDYGYHLFEDPEYHHLWSPTKVGRYHIQHLGLNNEFFIRQRMIRSEVERHTSFGEGRFFQADRRTQVRASYEASYAMAFYRIQIPKIEMRKDPRPGKRRKIEI